MEAEVHTQKERPGRAFEASIEGLFTAHGYTCQRNAIRTGRSGGQHEVDVLAETTDGLTTYRLAVECKARHLPVDKEVVAKLAFVVRDLGLHKGIVVSLSGSRVGAERSAAELGIDLWGPAELEARLGRTALQGLAGSPAVRLGAALPLRVSAQAADRLLHRQRRRWWRGGPERVEWIELLWVPHHLLCLAVTIPGGHPRRPVRGGGALRTSWCWNLYEALTGTLAGTFDGEPEVEDTDVTPSLPSRVAEATVATWLRKTTQRRHEVVTPAARERYAAQLETFGLPGDATAVTVESSRLVHLPFRVAFLTSAAEAHIVAVDGTTGRVSPEMGEVLTAAIGVVEEVLAS